MSNHKSLLVKALGSGGLAAMPQPLDT